MANWLISIYIVRKSSGHSDITVKRGPQLVINCRDHVSHPRDSFVRDNKLACLLETGPGR